MPDQIKHRLIVLAEAARLAGLPPATEKQIEFIASLMARKNISLAYFKGDMLTMRGASNTIEDLKVIQGGVC